VEVTRKCSRVPWREVPTLSVLDVAPLRAAAVSQSAQLPVVVSGSVGYLQAGLTDVSLDALLGIGAAAGTITGALPIVGGAAAARDGSPRWRQRARSLLVRPMVAPRPARWPGAAGRWTLGRWCHRSRGHR
jgi:hypothetical protein